MFFFFSSRRRHTRCSRDWSSDVCSSDLKIQQDYVDDPNMHTVTAGALHGLLESLDPQSSYLTPRDRKSTRLNSSHGYISYAVFCLKKKKKQRHRAIL